MRLVLALGVGILGCSGGPEPAHDASSGPDAQPGICQDVAAEPAWEGSYALRWDCEGACPGGAPLTSFDRLRIDAHAEGYSLRYTSTVCTDCVGADEAVAVVDSLEAGGVDVGGYRSEPYTLCDVGELQGVVTWRGYPGTGERVYRVTGERL